MRMEQVQSRAVEPGPDIEFTMSCSRVKCCVNVSVYSRTEIL